MTRPKLTTAPTQSGGQVFLVPSYQPPAIIQCLPMVAPYPKLQHDYASAYIMPRGVPTARIRGGNVDGQPSVPLDAAL